MSPWVRDPVKTAHQLIAFINNGLRSYCSQMKFVNRQGALYLAAR